MGAALVVSYSVSVPCKSRLQPGTHTDGTYIIMERTSEDAVDFSIMSPGTGPRWLEISHEFDALWVQLTAAGRRHASRGMVASREEALLYVRMQTLYMVAFAHCASGCVLAAVRLVLSRWY